MKTLIINESTQRPCGKMTITDVEEYQDIVNERLDELLQSFTEEEGLIISIENCAYDLEDLPDGIKFLYHDRAIRLYERTQRRFCKLGRHYFGDEIEDMDISSVYISD